MNFDRRKVNWEWSCGLQGCYGFQSGGEGLNVGADDYERLLDSLQKESPRRKNLTLRHRKWLQRSHEWTHYLDHRLEKRAKIC